MSDNSRLLEIEKLLEEEKQELEEAQKMAEEILPVLENLNRKDVFNPVMLKVKLAKLDKKYRDAIYTLFRIAVIAGPEGSFMVLSPEKVMSFIKENKLS
jgi:hypothetical protein